MPKQQFWMLRKDGGHSVIGKKRKNRRLGNSKQFNWLWINNSSFCFAAPQFLIFVVPPLTGHCHFGYGTFSYVFSEVLFREVFIPAPAQTPPLDLESLLFLLLSLTSLVLFSSCPVVLLVSPLPLLRSPSCISSFFCQGGSVWHRQPFTHMQRGLPAVSLLPNSWPRHREQELSHLCSFSLHTAVSCENPVHSLSCTLLEAPMGFTP